MKLFEFEKHFPDEESCRNKFKEMRDKEGVICLNAEVKSMFGCPATNNTNANIARNSISLRSRTVMHSSKLPFRCWYSHASAYGN